MKSEPEKVQDLLCDDAREASPQPSRSGLIALLPLIDHTEEVQGSTSVQILVCQPDKKFETRAAEVVGALAVWVDAQRPEDRTQAN